MKEIKFTTQYEQTLSFDDKDFKNKYEERVGNNKSYTQVIDNEVKHLAICPRCNNPVVILGIYKKIESSPHARHRKNVNIPGVTQFDEYKYLHCPYHRKRANYIREYVPETEEPQRQALYTIAKENFDKAIYLLKEKTGIYISLNIADLLAQNYVAMRAYNYIDATIYNIPWYLVYCHDGLPLHHMIIKKHSTFHNHLKQLGIILHDSKIKHHVYVDDNRGLLLRATNYRYIVDDNDNLNEWLDFSILIPDENVTDTLLYNVLDRFSVSVDSYHFANLINYNKWKVNQPLLDIAANYMNP